MTKIVFFTVVDERNAPYAEMMFNSLKKFHPDVETITYTTKDSDDPHMFYRQKPLFGRLLLEQGYDLVIGMDADQVVTGSLDHLFTDDYDVGVVLNWNRVDPQKYNFPLTVWDIGNENYYNCGLVAMRSLKLVNHWWRICNRSNFVNYRFREQDLLNIICHYGDYDVKCFDHSSNWHGLVSSGEWLNFKLDGDRLYLPVVNNYPEEEKTIKVIHYAGGNVSRKMTFNKDFTPEIATHLKGLCHGKK